jgi:beta-phosphoglucomutase-like phosphatase (HAD superfamily)
MTKAINLPHLGVFSADDGLAPLAVCSDGWHRVGEGGVQVIAATGDGKVEFIGFDRHTLAFVRSALGYPAYYPVFPVGLQRPVRAVLMDLDGTSVHSEPFWVWIIQMTTASLLGKPSFELEEADLPHVSGHSVSEHLSYCLAKYCPDRSLEQARALYFEHTRRELAAILAGGGRKEAMQPAPGLKDFLLWLKGRGIKIALVTSGLYEKATPEIKAAFDLLGLGAPEAFYDAVITAGFPLRPGEAGTLGELTPKPHPWLYAEACRVGLGIPFEQRHSVIGIDDSGAGVCSARLAGFTTVGMAGGNIEAAGARALCQHYCRDFEAVARVIEG